MDESKKAKKVSVYLTTIDNPFDPRTQWTEWRKFDEDHGYYTTEYLARIAKTADSLPEEEYIETVESAIDAILALNVLGIYKKLVFYDENE